MPEALGRGGREASSLTVRVVQDGGGLHEGHVSSVLSQAPKMFQKINTWPEKRNC